MDAKELLEKLGVEEIKALLFKMGAEEVLDESENKGYLITNTICHNLSGGKMKLYYFTKDKDGNDRGVFHCFTSCGDNFNIYELVMRHHKLKGIDFKFNDSIAWICRELGIENHSYKKPEGFGHEDVRNKSNDELKYLKKFNRKKVDAPTLVKHDMCILNRFTKHAHQSWLEDNISIEAIRKFSVLFSYVDHAIIVPHKHYKDGALIGIRMRHLDEWKIKSGMKYIPYQTFGETGILYSYPTHYNLYGLWENKEHIKKTKRIMIVEGEKSVLQCENYFPDENFTVALSGSSISEAQCRMIEDLGVETVYVGLDREYKNIDGQDFKIYQKKVLQLVYRLIPYVKVKIVYDSEGDKLGYKQSPTDCGKETLLELMKSSKIASLIDE